MYTFHAIDRMDDGDSSFASKHTAYYCYVIRQLNHKTNFLLIVSYLRFVRGVRSLRFSKLKFDWKFELHLVNHVSVCLRVRE